ncbi:uncharacterized protein Tco025E_00460 [Trypanosoma conorhini]|uniref:Uncharacterized protein n=1 Tax=Trypanosoma conorhini TaxID=83891 RepID=A0A422QBE0_9TRYP|nr:uncharacterized protein Tco025E_00460 [Trypanosoma conorhini]RNF27269.1 hypothetical protein Tco025E_00460 [Trypanosoma conorhini]
MPVNEAPWLTRRVEVVFMIVTFLICLASDGLKCKNGGVAPCIGGSSPCERDVNAPSCDDVVTPVVWRDDKERCACVARGDARLLLHVVEVGPSLPPTRSGGSGGHSLERLPIAALVASALKNRSGGVAASSARGGIFGASLFAPLRSEVGLAPSTTGPCAANTSSLKVSYSFDTLLIRPLSSLLRDTESVIPFKNDFFAIQRHLPRLQRVFEQLFSQKARAAAPTRDACSNVHLVILLMVMPGSDASWVNGNPMDIATTLFDAHTYVKKTLTRYLRNKPRYTRLLSSIWYVGVPVGFPVHCGTPDSASDATAPPLRSAYDVEGRKNASVSSAAVVRNITSAFCRAEDANFEVCRAMCQHYEQQVAAYQVANNGLQQIAEEKGGRVGMRSFFLPYRDHFHTALSTRRLYWRDCLQLSRKGDVAVAKSIAASLFAPH